jgi:hypothetical protein
MAGQFNQLMMQAGPPSDPYQQWLQLAAQHAGVAPDVLHGMMQRDPDAPWVQNLKRLVDPNVDPRAITQPQNQNTDPGLNRLGPQIGPEVWT